MYSGNNSTSGKELWNGSTDSNGTFDITLASGTYIIVASVAGKEYTYPEQGVITVENGTLRTGSAVYGNGSRVILYRAKGEEGPSSGANKCEVEDTNSIIENMICLSVLVIAVIVVGVALASGVFYSRISGRAVLENATRQRIMNHIRENPGIHFRALQRDLDIGIGTLTHHLRTLEREEYIKVVTEGQMKHYYPASMTVQHEVHLSIPQQKILTAIKEHPGITPREIADNTGLSRKAVYYHIEILRQMSLIYVEKHGRDLRCYPRA